MRSIQAGIALFLLAAGGLAEAASICGDLQNAYGPYDYRRRAEFVENFRLVEGGHFTASVENGIKGKSGTIGADVDYVLRAIPNHPRALATMARQGLKEKKVKLPGANYPVECYFDRAIRFAPDDGAVRATYGNYLFALGQDDMALKMFAAAVDLSPEDATINYNAGLAYFKKKDYEKANMYAQKAYALGFPLPGLKNKLVQAGQWKVAAQ